MKSPKSAILWLALLIFIVLASIAAFIYFAYYASTKAIGSFAECAAAGYPIQESYPEVCRVPGGSSFTNPDQSIQY